MPDLRTALDAHRRAVHDFLASARAVPAAQWDRPRAEGKWSPGQVAEHVALSYEASHGVFLGRVPGEAPPRFLRPLLRIFLLGPVLRMGRFPAASRAPAVLRPQGTPAAAALLLDRVQAAATAFERAAESAGGVAIDHPAFGRLPVVDFVRLQEIHTRHHRAQLSPRAS